MKKSIYLGTVLVLVMGSCGSEANDKVVEDKSVIEIVEEVAPQTPHELELNDGEKWDVDKGMTEAINKINSLFAEYSSNELVDYQLLGDSIGEQTKKIIRSCTMKGKGHDELHKWLLPFLDLKKALVMASSPEEGAALVDDIKDELVIYNQFFK